MKPFDARLLKYAHSARRYIAFLVLLGFIMTLLIAIQTILIAAALSPIFYGTASRADVIPLLLWLALIFLLRTALQYLRSSVGHRAALQVISTFRTQVLRHAANLGERWLSQGNTTRVVTLATRGLDDLEAYFVSFLPQLFLCVTASPVLIVVMLAIDWVSALAVVLCIPLIPLFMILIGKMTASYSGQRLRAMQELGAQLLDLLAGLATLKAVGREKGPQKRVYKLGKAFTEKTMQTLYVAFLSGAALEFLTTLSTAIVAVEVGFRMVAGQLMLFEGLVLIMLTPEVFKPLREVGTQFHASSNGMAAAKQAFAILETSLPADTPLPADAQLPSAKLLSPATANPTLNSSAPAQNISKVSFDSPADLDLKNTVIRLEDLSVYAPGRTTVAPANLSGTISPQKITVLRGPSGAGKSTTVQVILGLLSPDSGTVFIGDIPLSQLDKNWWWKNISWVPQQPVLVPGTISENLEVTDPEHNLPLLEAAKLTGFLEVINSLPAGWDTKVGQGGVGLSVGQRQRLALTRALISEKQIIILDEPSAHLDAVSEEYVANALQFLKAHGHTVIVIAHRAALAKLADTVIDIESGIRDISAEIALQKQQAEDAATKAHREMQKYDYALPTSWGKKTGGNND